MTREVSAESLAPVLSIAEGETDKRIRIAALDAATRFPLSEEAWHECAAVVRETIFSEPDGSEARRTALKLAARIPLMSVRSRLRDMAQDPSEADKDIVAAALERAGDPSRIEPLLERADAGDEQAFQLLAAMPLEDEYFKPDDIPPLPEGTSPDASFWRALVLARLGDFAALGDFLEGRVPGPGPGFFSGSPWIAYDTIAAIRPIPEEMRDHLLDALDRLGESEQAGLVQLIVWAATGIADAQGNPPPEEKEKPAVAGGSAPAQPILGQVGQMAKDLARWTIERVIHHKAEPLIITPKQIAKRVKRTVTEGNIKAHELPKGAPASVIIGNKIIEAIPSEPDTTYWPVADLALKQLAADTPALDDGQMSWIIARDEPQHMIREMTGLLTPDRPARQRLFLLGMLAGAADYHAGRGGSPWRGAGPSGGEAPNGRGPLIDDMPRASMAAPDYEEAPMEAAAGEEESEWEYGAEAETEPAEEQRRVHAKILHDGQRRNTFLTGADNVIRCWIGLPEPEHATVAETPIPRVEIPPTGLPLTAELCWGDQSDHQPLLLPADRTARTRDCDLHLHVPEGEHYISAEIMFRYKGRAFEVVHVEAFALPPGEEEQPHHEVKVRVQVSQRQIIELPERSDYNATIIWGEDSSRTARQPQAVALPSLRVFGGQGGRRYELQDAATALDWLNQTLFVTEKSLVRRRAAVGVGDTEPLLDADDAEVLTLLRDMARHGAVLYNSLRAQGFEDPGERIQLLNREPRAYVPLEFVYDRGYPADDARLCDGWKEALLSDELTCPVCSQVQLADDQRDWVPTICPLGFWSLQKIIERLDPESEVDETGTVNTSVPRPDRRNLPVMDTTLFASSHRVPENERQATWQALQQCFPDPIPAEDWLEWKKAVKDKHPPLLLVLPHHDAQAALDYLEIGDQTLPPQMGRLSRGQLTDLYVNPDRIEPGPIVLLLGCQTGAQTEVGYVRLARRFQQLHISIVLGTLAKILGRHAAPVARELVSQLVAVEDPNVDFGTIMRRVRRRMLANGYLMALCLVALGDAEWRLTPRHRPGPPAGGTN